MLSRVGDTLRDQFFQCDSERPDVLAPGLGKHDADKVVLEVDPAVGAGRAGVTYDDGLACVVLLANKEPPASVPAVGRCGQHLGECLRREKGMAFVPALVTDHK